MKHCKAPENQTTRRILLIACATALAVAFTVALPQPAHADDVTPPPVPANIQVPAGNKAFLEGHAVGTQNYICRPSDPGFKFVLFTPEATLFNDDGKQLTTHFFSPNPFEANTDPTVVGENMIRATWQHSRDTSTVWAQLDAPPAFVTPDAIPWLRLKVPGRWSPRRTDRWRHADEDHLHSAGEYLWRGRTVDGLYLVNRRRQEGVGALHGRLLLLQVRKPGSNSHEPWLSWSSQC